MKRSVPKKYSILRALSFVTFHLGTKFQSCKEAGTKQVDRMDDKFPILGRKFKKACTCCVGGVVGFHTTSSQVIIIIIILQRNDTAVACITDDTPPCGCCFWWWR
jgi:hypothetical protein